MNASSSASVRSRIENVVALAQLLDRVEARAVTVGADQYRTLVRQVSQALGEDLPEGVLQAVLGACPAAAELYENLHYAQSGLSRSPLERSVSSEMIAREALTHAARKA